jgi:hypothetical protein
VFIKKKNTVASIGEKYLGIWTETEKKRYSHSWEYLSVNG